MDEPTLESLVTHLSLSLQSEFAWAEKSPPDGDPFWAQFVKEILEASGDLLIRLPTDWPEKLVSTADPLATHAWIWFVVGYTIAAEVVNQLEFRVRGALQLAAHVRPGGASNRTKNLFRLVGRSFIAGHHTECAVMLRAMIESEIVAEIPNDDCARILGARDLRTNPYTLHDRLAVARKTFKLTHEGCDAATRVRDAGNQALHRFDGASFDVNSLVADAFVVLRELDGTTGPS